MVSSNRRRSPFGQLRLWGVALVVVYIVIQFIAFQSSLNRMPTSWTVAGESFPDLSISEVVLRIEDAFDTPVRLHYYGNVIPLEPASVGFRFDPDATLETLNQIREQSSGAGNFVRHLLGRPPEAQDLPIVAHYSDEDIRRTLSDIALQLDKPAQSPIPDLSTMRLSAAQAGYTLDIAASVKPVADALTSLTQRDAKLIIDEQPGGEISIAQLESLIRERLKTFRGNASVFLKDLQTGEEILVNPDIAYSGLSLLKIGIMGEVYRLLDTPDIETTNLLTETLGADSSNFTANVLLTRLGNGDPFAGAEQLSASLRFLGLGNTFIAAPYDEENLTPPGIVTAANSRTDVWANPDPYRQTTASDAGLLLEMIYQCSKGGGTLMVAYPGQFTPEECAQMLDIMKLNILTDAEGIPTLLRGGLPEGTPFAHKHGWDFDTRADASIAFTPGGDFVLVVFLNTPQEWVEWDLANVIMVDLARAAYNYFNP